MAAAGLSRNQNPKTASITASATTTETIDMKDMAGGLVQVPAGSGLTSLTYWASFDGETFLALYDRTNTAVTQTVAASRTYPLPDECYGARAIRIVGNTTGDVGISLKS